MNTPQSRLRRELGVGGAIVIGLGAMLGTGVFAVWTPAYALAGPWLLVALAIAAATAALNAASTVRLARALPESGGAYAYGRAFLNRPAALIAGYAFVIGKSASAGAAALTIGAYAWPGHERAVGLAAVVAALALDLRGVVKSVRVSAVLVVVVLAVLAVLAVSWWAPGTARGVPTGTSAHTVDILAAGGLLFVAFAGYARVTVLGEEVRDPVRTIPRAVTTSFLVVAGVYVVIAVTVLSAVASGIELGPASLEGVASAAGGGGLVAAVRIAAVLAAGAVLLSLLAGVGRTLFAMGSRGDAPRALAVVGPRGVPARGDLAAAVLAGLVVMLGGIGFALALSAATVLTYYAVAHLAAWCRGRREGEPYRVVPALGLLLCGAVVAGLLAASVG
ncbi:MAG: APC family permease [Candidatus Nanopelagicales bacterium]